MRTAKVEVDGTVRVSVAPGFVPVLMRGMLPALREAHPALGVELRGGFQRVDLAKGEADIAAAHGAPERARPGGAPRLRLRLVRLCVGVPTSRRAAARPSFDDAGAARARALYRSPAPRAAAALDGGVPRHGARSVSRVDNLEIACQTIAAGGGIAVLPCFIADAVPESAARVRRARGGQHRLGRLSRGVARHRARPRGGRRAGGVLPRNEAMFSG